MKSNATLIGAFILGAIALVAFALIFLTPLLRAGRATPVIFNFDAGVTGLQLGAPITFRGVKVGEVTAIRAAYDPANKQFLFPVEGRLTERVEIIGRQDRNAAEQLATVRNEVIERFGLRARLEVISFVTGLQRVQLDFEPGTQLELHGGGPSGWWEIPTLPSRTQELEEFLTGLPVGEIVNDLRVVLENVNDLLGPTDGKERRNVRDMLAAATGALAQVEKSMPRVTSSLENTASAARQTFAAGTLTLEQVRLTAASAEKRVNSVADAIDRMAESGDKTLDSTRQTMRNIENLTSENSPLVYELNTALKELAAAARSIRLLATELEKRPDALLRGRPGEEGKQ
ncbi:MAG: MlaD family protein [Burkholderiales bacterium]